MKMNKTECAYCMHNVTAPKSEGEQLPELDDDAAWAKIAKEHAATCEWVQTRAHRKPAAQVGA
jgi:hypothetical protein